MYIFMVKGKKGRKLYYFLTISNYFSFIKNMQYVHLLVVTSYHTWLTKDDNHGHNYLSVIKLLNHSLNLNPMENTQPIYPPALCTEEIHALHSVSVPRLANDDNPGAAACHLLNAHRLQLGDQPVRSSGHAEQRLLLSLQIIKIRLKGVLPNL